MYHILLTSIMVLDNCEMRCDHAPSLPPSPFLLKIPVGDFGLLTGWLAGWTFSLMCFDMAKLGGGGVHIVASWTGRLFFLGFDWSKPFYAMCYVASAVWRVLLYYMQ